MLMHATCIDRLTETTNALCSRLCVKAKALQRGGPDHLLVLGALEPHAGVSDSAALPLAATGSPTLILEV